VPQRPNRGVLNKYTRTVTPNPHLELPPLENTPLEVSPNLPDAPGVRAMLKVLSTSRFATQLSVGRVCGGRISAVWLGESLTVSSVTLEASELSDTQTAHARAVDFIEELEQCAQSDARVNTR
jgi:hypothetical protein